jgi:hypothetical protein
MVASRLVEITDKEISEIKINSVPKKTQKTCVKMLKQLFASGTLIIGDYNSPRLRPAEYLSFIDPERGGFGVIYPKVMMEGNTTPNPPSGGSINDILYQTVDN